MSESLIRIFRHTVGAFGNCPALVEGNIAISYTELDAKSDEIAAAVERMKLRPGSKVGIFRKKSIPTVAAIYGVLKAGCAYVPIDTKMGPDKLAAVLQDAGLEALIVDPVLEKKIQDVAAGGLGYHFEEVSSSGDLLYFAGPSGVRNTASMEPSLAYILYTSGSTGIPKGVQHTNASALAFVSWAVTEFNISSSDRLSCHAPLHFDLTIFDLFAAAMTGACVVLIPDDVAIFPLQVASIIKNERISIWYSVPFALIQLLERGDLGQRDLALREVIFAGERFPPTQLQQLARTLPKVRLTNLFGPTETNVCTYHHLSPPDLASDQFCPIGIPCPYSLIEVVNENGNRVAAGETGELLVGGASVMTGYLNKPELNEKKFVTRMIQGQAERLFRTGDLVSMAEGQPMFFHGRFDRQVKVRGFRIELDEIEAALANCAGVAAAAVWIDNDRNGFAEVRAAVASDAASAKLSGDDLIWKIRRQLSVAAVPLRVCVLSSLPRTVNGKIDYAELARLEA
ncbi:MAG TPA: amino acid adenylation domain-containing protein [Terriglobia bacterium]|nr:amino acid adenylation domain-containing protein [Terriglobia bacterium]